MLLTIGSLRAAVILALIQDSQAGAPQRNRLGLRQVEGKGKGPQKFAPVLTSESLTKTALASESIISVTSSVGGGKGKGNNPATSVSQEIRTALSEVLSSTSAAATEITSGKGKGGKNGKNTDVSSTTSAAPTAAGLNPTTTAPAESTTRTLETTLALNTTAVVGAEAALTALTTSVSETAAAVNATITAVATQTLVTTVAEVSTITQVLDNNQIVVSTITNTAVSVETVVTTPVTQTIVQNVQNNVQNNIVQNVVVSSTTIIVQQVSLFTFAPAVGAVCPAVMQQPSGQFIVVGSTQTFVTVNQAAAAACEIQFTSCQRVAGVNFQVTNCQTQLQACNAAATVHTVTVSQPPTTLTQTVILPPAVESQSQAISSEITQGGASIITLVVAPVTVTVHKTVANGNGATVTVTSNLLPTETAVHPPQVVGQQPSQVVDKQPQVVDKQPPQVVNEQPQQPPVQVKADALAPPPVLLNPGEQVNCIPAAQTALATTTLFSTVTAMEAGATMTVTETVTEIAGGGSACIASTVTVTDAVQGKGKGKKSRVTEITLTTSTGTAEAAATAKAQGKRKDKKQNQDSRLLNRAGNAERAYKVRGRRW